MLTGAHPGELCELGAALEALGTPMEGLDVEAASELQRRVSAQVRV